MPHHESGLLALKTTNTKVLDQAIGAALEKEPGHRVELVRVAGGKGVLVCFGSIVLDDGSSPDMSFFTNTRALGALARTLKQPLWAGFAYGGYTNSQQALHFGADGKLKWRSKWNFGLEGPAHAEHADPFTLPERRTALVLEVRASNGYGRIGTDLGFDYFNVLDIEAGDPLFARDKRRYGAKKMAEHRAWLKSKFVPPEGDSGDTAQPPRASQEVVYRLLDGGQLDLDGFTTTFAKLAAHHSLAPEALLLARASAKSGTWLRVSGKAMKRFSPLLVSEEFLELLAVMSRAGLVAWGGEGKRGFSARGGVNIGRDFKSFLSAGRERPEPAVLKWRPLAMKADAKRAKQLDALRDTRRATPDDEDQW